MSDDLDRDQPPVDTNLDAPAAPAQAAAPQDTPSAVEAHELEEINDEQRRRYC